MPTNSQMMELLVSHPDMTYQEVGEIVGCSRQRVHQIIRKTGFKKKSRLHRTDITIEKVLELYRNDSNFLVKDIARIFDCHENTITKRLRAAGVCPSESYSRKNMLY